MSRAAKILLTINVVVVALLVFILPHLMVAPGKLVPAHRSLETDCFACHVPFRGAAAERCMTCHKRDDIGLRSTSGQPLAKRRVSTPFHQSLIAQDCTACHGDHAGTTRYGQAGRFSHALLQAGLRDKCQSCHQPPADGLHRQIVGNCTQCHSQSAWIPATFDHGKLFVLDANHRASCATCHPRNDYGSYTCYGCHEHTPENIRGEHIEEGISDFRNCVACHRSAGEQGEGGDGGRDD